MRSRENNEKSTVYNEKATAHNGKRAWQKNGTAYNDSIQEQTHTPYLLGRVTDDGQIL